MHAETQGMRPKEQPARDVNMENNEEMNEFIDRYLMGKLSLWELAEIENKIKTDSSFAEEVGLQRDLLIGIQESRRVELKEKLNRIEGSARIFRLRIDKPALIRYAIAASITLLVAGSFFYQNLSEAMVPNSKRGHYSFNSE